MTVRRFFRYGVAAEKKIFEANSTAFDGLVIPAHLACDQRSLATFVRKLNKPYFVDPMTFSFAVQDNDFTAENGELKRSYRKLTESIEWPIEIDFSTSQRLAAPAVSAVIVQSPQRWSAFVRSILDLQKKLTKDPEEEKEIKKLLKLIEETGQELDFDPEQMETESSPAWLVPPYFFFDNYADPWYDINNDAFRTARGMEPEQALYACIAAGKDWLSTAAFTKVVQDFAQADGFVVWIDEFWEFGQSPEMLTRLRLLVKTLSQGGSKGVFLLYSNMFGTFLADDGLTGYSSGLGYGDNKARLSATGGLPAPRYFVPGLYQNLVREELVPFLRSFGSVACDCEICRERKRDLNLQHVNWPDTFVDKGLFPRPVREKRSYADGENQLALKTHFLLTSRRETEKYAGLTGPEIAKKLRDTLASVTAADPVFARSKAAHLRRWALALDAEVVAEPAVEV